MYKIMNNYFFKIKNMCCVYYITFDFVNYQYQTNALDSTAHYRN